MSQTMLASDRVVLLLSLIPYLREHGPTPVEELARTFDVDAPLLRKLIAFLGTAGIPGETLAYQHNDLFDIDWDDFAENDIVSLTQTVAVDDTPRFTGVETAALLAGLAALQPILPEPDAALARQLAARLGAAMGRGEVPAVVVTREREDDRIPTLLSAIEGQRVVTFTYRDAAGAETHRTVHPKSLTERQGVWYLRGFNVERGEDRTFAVQQVSGLAVLEPSAPPLDGAPALDPSLATPSRATPSRAPEQEDAQILAVVPARLLSAIRGFDPVQLADTDARVAPGSVPPGCVLVAVDAWHAGTAVRLVQHAPGEIVVVAPPAARAAVSEWAEVALARYGA